jgi:hypothetical protein
MARRKNLHKNPKHLTKKEPTGKGLCVIEFALVRGGRGRVLKKTRQLVLEYNVGQGDEYNQQK